MFEIVSSSNMKAHKGDILWQGLKEVISYFVNPKCISHQENIKNRMISHNYNFLFNFLYVNPQHGCLLVCTCMSLQF